MSHLLTPPTRLAPLYLACLFASPVLAQEQDAVQLDAMTISGMTLDEVDLAREQLNEVPGATNVVDMQQVAQGRVAGVADVLAYQPGVYAQSPGNEGVKISIRGSGINRGPGAHASGNHIMLDGLPLTGSGGTPYELLEPLWLSRAEVLRGANGFERGALALGGAVDYITRSGFDAPRLQLRMEAGTDGYLKRHIASGQVIGNLDYYVGLTDLHYDGQQDHSAGSGKGVVANVGLQLTPDLETRFYLRYRETEHQTPGRLTQSQIDDDPTQANAANIARDAKREQPGSTWLANKTTLRLDDVSTLEVGLVYHHYPMDLMESPYRIRVDYSDISATLNYTREHQLFGLNSNTTVGWRTTTNLPSSDAKETAYEVWTPDRAQPSVTYPIGTLMRRYIHQGSDNVLHVSNDLELAPNLWLTSGLALIYTEREVEVTWPDTDQKLNEGTWDYAPRLGLRYQLESGTELYGNLSRSVEPPHAWSMIWGSPIRFVENTQPWSRRQSTPVSLDNQTATTFEVGARGDSIIGLWDLAWYYSRVNHELLSVEVEPGFSPETNASATVHQGVEAGLTSTLWQGDKLGALALRQAYTFSDFHYRDDDTFGSNPLPGLPRHYYQGELRYQHPTGVYVGLNTQYASKVPVDYANSWSADSYTTFGATLGYDAPQQDWQAWLELRNLTDEHYAATVTPGYNDNGVEAARLTPGESFGVYTGFSWSWL
ncbi:TonB-dependent receptor [Pseudomonas neustonica]|uniref:TonB-dependent receptor n=1 Tax=Pseudomonas neustonica TaxID=2487346 RepID=A0ABX9XG33_9PSED|nr:MULTISPECIES: TonB-dependent receptor [Pseudomonas]ROZ80305.1 TonB-dependent receptor [Pseudomonas sp. SSM44]ROZ81323.1 TonB-dependent receptor [Pseudomonas neustonica]|tara:strand:- start:2301 stop:4439 length:2139 start_codon:yes stop_codon:yes gene_type:complete